MSENDIQYRVGDEPVFTALCLQEHMFENKESAWSEKAADYQEDEGVAAVRDLIRVTAVKIAKAYGDLRAPSDRDVDIVDYVNDVHGSYDLGLVPLIADRVAGIIGDDDPIKDIENMSFDEFKGFILETLPDDVQAKISAYQLKAKSPKVA